MRIILTRGSTNEISSEGVIAIGSAGERKAGSGIAFTTDDVVHLGSCTKAMTATMLATLVAEGKLSWDTKLIEAIPELKNRIHTDYHEITLWHLLTHRAGIPKNPTDEEAFSSTPGLCTEILNSLVRSEFNLENK